MNTGVRNLRVAFQPGWDPGSGGPHRGLFSPDPRVRTLLKVLVSYQEVRHVLPDQISLEPAASAPLVETIARFLGRQSWLVRRVDVG
ncbi:MAG TPA: hypothetical protein VEL75_06215 [Candidatus Methylomirabilis sp.]|nr:hypothetical protein [Candidatus Methylomirabilis sp.]